VDSRVWRIPEAVRSQAPEAALLLDAVNAAAWRTVSPVQLEEVRVRMAQMLCFAPGLGRFSAQAREGGLNEHKLSHVADYFRSDDYTDQERAMLGFAEQFVLDVSQFTPQGREAMAGAIGSQDIFDVVTAIYVIEYTQRLESIVTAVIGSEGPGTAFSSAPPAAAAGSEEAGVRQLLADYSAAVMRLRELDPVTTELVRLRCARTHNCRICQTLRASDARSAGHDEMTRKVDFYESSDLDERVKTALRITDAFILNPGDLTEATTDAAIRLFTEAELVELCLDITKWATQKIKVSLGADGADRLPKNEAGMSFFTFGLDGLPASSSAEDSTQKRRHGRGVQTMHALPVPWVQSDDVSNALLFLASQESRYVTGVALPIDAGCLVK
jgi:alkylhydroperoxidase family enzyme